MATVISHMSMSLDGFVAGPDQSPENALGIGGLALHRWHFDPVGQADVPWRDQLLDRGDAYVMGRNMFGPIRGPWPDDTWKGWWGDDPPYHTPVFVLTNYARPPIAMNGGTTFHFVTDGIHAAHKRASEAAGDRDIRLGGGVATIRQYLSAGLIDEMHLAISPVLLGSGEHLLAGIDAAKLGYRCTEHVATENAMHVVLTKRS